MKKRLITTKILMLLLGSGLACSGKAINENTAKTIGSNYLISNNIPGVSGTDGLSTAYVATAQVNGTTIVDYYVFNFTSGPGFIMVSGDDNIIPILAYSPEAWFDRDKMSPSAKDWTEGYQNQITAALQHNLPAKEGTAEQWANLRVARSTPAAKTTTTFPSSTAFLCQTTWDQNPVYNTLCPGSGSGQAPTGCVATAMAQVMKFWNWPTVGCGAHTYTPSPNPDSYPGQSADFSNTAYDWTSMGTSLTASNAAIEKLMYHIGVSLEMQYSVAESGTYVTESETPAPYTSSAEYAFKTYFHYKRSIHGQLRDGIATDYYAAFHCPAQAAYSGDAPWYSMIETELNAGRPLLYKGQGTSGGHCWVCDGYNASNMMHFNWGWSGTGPNGWYTVDNLAPPALGTGGGSGNFNTDQGVLLGIKPDVFMTASGNIKLQSFVDCPNIDAYPYNSAISVAATIQNGGSTAFSGSVSAQAFDTSGNYVATIQTYTSQTLAAGATSAPYIFTNPGLLVMIPGQYNIRIMYQATGAKTWTAVNNNGNYINDDEIDVRNSGFTSSALEVYAPVVVTGGVNIDMGHSLIVNTQIRNMFQTTAFGTYDFSGQIQGSLINVATGASYVVQNFPSANINESSVSPFTFTQSSVTAPDGEYVFAVQFEPASSSSFSIVGSDYYINPIIVHVHTNAGVNNVVTADNIAVFPNPASDVVNILAQGVNVDHVSITDMQGREITAMNITGNPPSINIPVSSFAPGMYLAQIHTPDGMVTKKIAITK